PPGLGIGGNCRFNSTNFDSALIEVTPAGQKRPTVGRIEYNGRRAVSKDLAALVDFFGIDQPRGNDLQSLRRGFAEKTTSITLVASRTDLLDFQQHRVGVAIDINGSDYLGVAALLAFPPETRAAAA